MPPPPPPHSGRPTRGVSAGRACAQRRLPPAARGAGGGQSAPAPPRPPARAGAVTGRAAPRPSAPPPPSPSSRAEPGGRGRWGGARRACAGAAPSLSPFAGSLPPSLAALAGNGSGPERPGCRRRAPPFRAWGPRLSAGSASGPRRADGRACVRPCAPSEPRAEPPPPPRPATTTRSPPPAAPPPAPSPLPPRPSAQARPTAREPIGCRRRARVRPRRARPHWPPRGNVSHMQIRAGRGGLRLDPSRPGAGPWEEGGREGALQ